ncbi:hypothetical protein KCU99_g3669, partial [Aureobasidium melanogenum]
MATHRPPPEIFQTDQYFWCSADNEHVDKWITDDCQAYPRIYPIYINDANMVLQRKRDGRPQARDEHMLTFLEGYPMTFREVVKELEWYKAMFLEKESRPQMTGLIDVNQHGSDADIVAQARDTVYRHVFNVDTRHQHWAWRSENGLLNPNEVEPLSKKQKNHERSKRRWEELDVKAAKRRAAGITDADIDPALFAEGPGGVNSRRYAERLLLDLEIGEKEKDQPKAEHDTEKK